jgi:predicted transcriptional regulator
MQRVRNVMIKNIRMVNSDMMLIDAMKIMKRYHAGIILVAKNRRLVGILTVGSIFNLVKRAGFKPEQIKVKEAMNTNLLYCYEDQNREKIEAGMKKKGHKYSIVLSRHKKVTGVFTLAGRFKDSHVRK